MSFVDVKPEGIFDPALDPVFRVFGDAHLFGDFIRLFKAYAKNIIHKLIRVFHYLLDGVCAINLIELHRIGRRNTKLLKV